MNERLAINERYPAPFEGLDYKTARSLVNEALHLTHRDEEIDERLLWEIRNMPECPCCGARLSSRYPLGGHAENCRARLRVVK